MNKKIINDIVSIIAIILLITSCLSKKIKEIEDIQLKKLCEISAKNMDSLKSINLFSSDDKGNLYIYDDINKRVVVFDSKGNYTYQFGRSGSGPGEFKNVFSIITTTSCILIIDISKYVIIKYNYIGQFMSEKKNSINWNTKSNII